MKQLSLIIIFLIAPFLVFAQDTIVKKNGDILQCNIQKEDSTNVYYTMQKNGQFTNAFINKNDVQSVKYGVKAKVASSLPDNISAGIGIGFDFGGYGANLTVYPQKNIGLFAGVGYPLAGVGYNAGAKLRMAPGEKFRAIAPYIIAMYGYNAAVYVTNSEDLNKIFYGPSIGIGVDFRSSPTRNIYSSIAFLYPVRSSEVQTYMDHLVDSHSAVFKNKLLPFGISIGAIFIINRIKEK